MAEMMHSFPVHEGPGPYWCKTPGVPVIQLWQYDGVYAHTPEDAIIKRWDRYVSPFYSYVVFPQ